MNLADVPLTELMGKTLVRHDVILKVFSISIGPSKSIFIHPGLPETFGWTFKNSDGTLCGDWQEVKA